MSRQESSSALFEYVTRLGDDRLVLGHRLSEWCGHAPILEEDIALANMALDNIGHAQLLLGLAADLEGAGRSADDLAYLREATEFRNVQMVELPKGDFAFTIVRQFLFDAYSFCLFDRLRVSRNESLAAIAAKVHKEVTYHMRHSGQWVVRLGDGTAESHSRAQSALDELWVFTAELFAADDVDREVSRKGFAPEPAEVEKQWRSMVQDVLAEATLAIPQGVAPIMLNGRSGRHSEHLGHMLAEMQILARSHPGAKW